MENEKTNFQKEIARLDEIVDSISNNALSLDESLKLYEEGASIIKKLEKELEAAKEKVEKIVEIK